MPNRGPRVSPALVGLIGAAIMFGLLFFAFANVALFASNLDVKAQVATGDTLAPNADVEVAGVKVGLVKSIDKGDPGALIDMTIDTKKASIYKDASLQIRPHGVFGPKFVAARPRHPVGGRLRRWCGDPSVEDSRFGRLRAGPQLTRRQHPPEPADRVL